MIFTQVERVIQAQKEYVEQLVLEKTYNMLLERCSEPDIVKAIYQDLKINGFDLMTDARSLTEKECKELVCGIIKASTNKGE